MAQIVPGEQYAFPRRTAGRTLPASWPKCIEESSNQFMCYRVGDTKTFGLAVQFSKLRKSPNVSDLPPSFWFPVASHTEGVGASVMHHVRDHSKRTRRPKTSPPKNWKRQRFLCGRIPMEHFEQCWRSEKKGTWLVSKQGSFKDTHFLGGNRTIQIYDRF